MGFEHMVGGVRGEGKARNENDYYPTPPFVTYALLQHQLRKSEEVPKNVWEPAAGRGWMAMELQRNNQYVLASDLEKYEDSLVHVETGSDFLKFTKSQKFGDAVITNPPYASNMAQKFIDKALSLDYKFIATLCRATFFESNTRYQGLFSVNPPTEIVFFSRRFSCNENMFFTDPFAGMVAYAWWIWDYRAGKRKTKASWIDTKAIYDDWRKSISDEDYAILKSYVDRKSQGLENLIVD